MPTSCSVMALSRLLTKTSTWIHLFRSSPAGLTTSQAPISQLVSSDYRPHVRYMSIRSPTTDRLGALALECDPLCLPRLRPPTLGGAKFNLIVLRNQRNRLRLPPMGGVSDLIFPYHYVLVACRSARLGIVVRDTPTRILYKTNRAAHSSHGTYWTNSFRYKISACK